MKMRPRVVFRAFFLVFIIFSIGIATIATHLYYSATIPKIDQLLDIRSFAPLKTITSSQKIITEHERKLRIPKKISEIPDLVIKSFVAVEDETFFTHCGVDFQRLFWSVINSAIGKRSNDTLTITRQIAQTFGSNRSLTNKVKEIFRALKLEKMLTKEQLLEIYLNQIYLGHSAFGVAAAAHIYYGKQLTELDLAQIAMIVALPKAPDHMNPIQVPTVAIQRRTFVLRRMLELKYINQQQYDKANNAPLTTKLANS